MAESHKDNTEWTKASHIGACVSLFFGLKAHSLLKWDSSMLAHLRPHVSAGWLQGLWPLHPILSGGNRKRLVLPVILIKHPKLGFIGPDWSGLSHVPIGEPITVIRRWNMVNGLAWWMSFGAQGLGVGKGRGKRWYGCQKEDGWTLGFQNNR